MNHMLANKVPAFLAKSVIHSHKNSFKGLGATQTTSDWPSSVKLYQDVPVLCELGWIAWQTCSTALRALGVKRCSSSELIKSSR